jgi:hypothetical protein
MQNSSPNARGRIFGNMQFYSGSELNQSRNLSLQRDNPNESISNSLIKGNNSFHFTQSKTEAKAPYKFSELSNSPMRSAHLMNNVSPNRTISENPDYVILYPNLISRNFPEITLLNMAI